MESEAARRAGIAARAVIERFGAPWRIGGVPLPFTHLARNLAPATPTSEKVFNYWWQAHYVDALVDAARREPTAEHYRWLAGRVLHSVWLRNRARWVNNFYDDMAWLALAADRFDNIAKFPSPTVSAIRAALRPQFELAHTADWGGGCYWSKSHDFKNAPASLPIAIWFAHHGHPDRAAAIADWVNKALVDPDTGLVRDGVREAMWFVPSDPSIYTYNQGTYLALLLTLGRISQATTLVDAIGDHLCVTGDFLRTDGLGDGGLFTGILVRYLARAAHDLRLPDPTRQRAHQMVTTTADALWSTHDPTTTLFSPDPQLPATTLYPPGKPIELTPQLQAWTILEAAATL